MSEKIIVGPIDKGLRNDRTAFVIDNDSFPTLINAYQWRGRVKRKRGTALLGRLTRAFYAGDAVMSLNSSGIGNLFTGFGLPASGNLVPMTLQVKAGSNVYTDSAGTGTLSPSGSVNYSTGIVTISAELSSSISANFTYYPGLPVMGLEDLLLNPFLPPGNLAFDTNYSYNMVTSNPYPIYDVSFYKNPLTASNLPAYVRKTEQTATSWNGLSYQQFWTVNYQGALWATNGMTSPFTIANIGMQYKAITAITVSAAGPPAIAVITIGAAHGLIIGDFVFINEVVGITGINFQTGYVTAVASTTVTVEFPLTILGGSYSGPTGIVQYLTNRSDVTKDCLRWYDGDPSANSANGWVNFCPPISHASFSISDLPAGQYYLVGARMLFPFKDRMLFIGPVVQTSTADSQVYLQDTVIYSQNGTPYYTCSFNGSVADAEILPTTTYQPMLVPTNQTATAPAYFSDVTGFGGFISTGLNQPIVSVNTNEDVLILGFASIQARFVYTGNDVVPFNFFTISSELGTRSTFSSISLDRGVLSIGNNGIILTSQTGAQRVDLQIPDQIFEFNLLNNGAERVCSQRDFINEWVYFTYLVNETVASFPNQTLQYNYRDESWAIFNESYTTYGTFKRVTGDTWATIGNRFPTWSVWNEPWNSGSSTLLQPQVIGGNQQGFVLFRDEGTAEGSSLSIQNISFPATITAITQANPAVITANNQFIPGQAVIISGVVGMVNLNGNTYTIQAATSTTITITVNSSGFPAYVSGGIATPSEYIWSPNHGLNNNDYIVINGALGSISTAVNGKVFSVIGSTINGFSLSPTPSTGLYSGGGVITRCYLPMIMTKQFPPSWGMSRKTRIGSQQYLFTATPNSAITLQMYLSQNSSSPYNSNLITPNVNSPNTGLIYSNVLSTSPEYPVTAIKGRSMGLFGDGVTLTYNLTFTPVLQSSTVVITIGSIASFTDDGIGGFNVTGTGVSGGSSIDYFTGAIVIVFSAAPNRVLSYASYSYFSNNLQVPTAVSQSQIWHRINTSLIGDTVQLGFTMNDAQMRDVTLEDQFAEIELHAFIIDTSPSQNLV